MLPRRDEHDRRVEQKLAQRRWRNTGVREGGGAWLVAMPLPIFEGCPTLMTGNLSLLTSRRHQKNARANVPTHTQPHAPPCPLVLKASKKKRRRFSKVCLCAFPLVCLSVLLRDLDETPEEHRDHGGGNVLERGRVGAQARKQLARLALVE